MTGKDTLRRFSLLVGRRNLYRASRFLMRTARGDVANDPAVNGERTTQEAALRVSVPPVTIFDVGANMGEWSASLLESAHNQHVNVHAFEPCSETFALLSERLASSPEVTLVNKACSQQAGTATMYVFGAGASYHAGYPLASALGGHDWLRRRWVLHSTATGADDQAAARVTLCAGVRTPVRHLNWRRRPANLAGFAGNAAVPTGSRSGQAQ